MRVVWLVFVGLLVAMVALLPRWQQRVAAPGPTPPNLTATPPPAPASAFASLRRPADSSAPPRADSIVAFGLAQRGTPYVYAGTSPLTGFDCSGFIMYTFAHFGVPVPHSTALLIAVGQPVARAEARPGDIVVFTGTAATSITPGHAGIVVSGRGEVPLRFVHASSARRESGVKVSQVEGTDYERRFMQVRRVLVVGEGSASRPERPEPPHLRTPIAALPVRPVAVVSPTAPPIAPPKKLTPKQYSTRVQLRRKAPKKGTVTSRKAPVRKPTTAKGKARSQP